MDSSNSTTVHSVDIVLGRHQVPTDELSPADRLAVVDDALDTVNALLQYFPEGKSVTDWIGRPLRAMIDSRRQTSDEVLVLPSELKKSSRLFLLKIVGDDIVNLAPWGSHVTYGLLSEWLMMLSRNGERVLWTSHYRVYGEPAAWPRESKTTHVEDSLSSVFTMLEGEDLQDLLERHPKLCRGIVDRLHSLTLAAITRRQEALDDMQYAGTILEGYLSRLE